MFNYLTPIEYLGLRFLSTTYCKEWNKNRSDLLILFNKLMTKRLRIYGLTLRDLSNFPTDAVTFNGRRVVIGTPFISGSKGLLFIRISLMIPL
jgi:hypothetical protein